MRPAPFPCGINQSQRMLTHNSFHGKELRRLARCAEQAKNAKAGRIRVRETPGRSFNKAVGECPRWRIQEVGERKMGERKMNGTTGAVSRS